MPTFSRAYAVDWIYSLVADAWCRVEPSGTVTRCGRLIAGAGVVVDHLPAGALPCSLCAPTRAGDDEAR